MVNTENSEQINLQRLEVMLCPVSQSQHEHHADSAAHFAFATALALLSQGSPLLIQMGHGAAGWWGPLELGPLKIPCPTSAFSCACCPSPFCTPPQRAWPCLHLCPISPMVQLQAPHPSAYHSPGLPSSSSH